MPPPAAPMVDDVPMSDGTIERRNLPEFWSTTMEDLLEHLQCRPEGLSAREAQRRLKTASPRLRELKRSRRVLFLLLAQFQSPIVLILPFAVTLSFFLGQATDALLILSIVLLSALLGFWQEWGAADAVEKLLMLVQVKATVLRDGQPAEVPVDKVVSGDVVVLNAGDIIPGD